MQNLLPAFRTSRLDASATYLSELQWCTREHFEPGESVPDIFPPSLPFYASDGLNNGRINTHVERSGQLEGEHQPTTAPSLISRPSRILHVSRTSRKDDSQDIEPSPLGTDLRGKPASAPNGTLPTLNRYRRRRRAHGEANEVGRARQVFLSLLNGVEDTEFEVYYSVDGLWSELHHRLLQPFETALELLSGPRRARQRRRSTSNNNDDDEHDHVSVNRDESMTDEQDDNLKASQGFNVTIVSEKTLEFEQSLGEGRVYRASFGPDRLGMDLTWDATHEAVVVLSVTPGAQADRLGTVKVGDRVLSINGVDIKSMKDVQRVADTRDLGQPLTMELLKPKASSAPAFQLISLLSSDGADEDRELHLDENDCALAPRTMLAHRPESQLVPLAGRLAQMMALSSDDALPVILHFANRSTRLMLLVYWIDYDGIRRHRCTLKPGEAYMERSFASHPWLVRCVERRKGEAGGTKRSLGQGAHGVVLRIGSEAARSGSLFTALWEPECGSLSVMPASRRDPSKPEAPPGPSDKEATLEHKVSQWRAKILQDLRDSRCAFDDDETENDRADSDETSAFDQPQDGSRTTHAQSKSTKSKGRRRAELPHLSLVIMDRNQRIHDALTKIVAQKRSGGAVKGVK